MMGGGRICERFEMGFHYQSLTEIESISQTNPRNLKEGQKFVDAVEENKKHDATMP